MTIHLIVIHLMIKQDSIYILNLSGDGFIVS